MQELLKNQDDILKTKNDKYQRNYKKGTNKKTREISDKISKSAKINQNLDDWCKYVEEENAPEPAATPADLPKLLKTPKNQEIRLHIRSR